MERKEYEMTQADLDKILEACKPVPYMVVGGVPPRSPQENANAAWAELGSRMGFDHMTVLPTGRGIRCFYAVPNDSQFRCTVCGQIGTVGRCCGLDTREPLNDLARAEVERGRKT